MSAPAFGAVKDEYTKRWSEMQYLPGAQGRALGEVHKLLSGKDRYLKVQRETGVSWFVIALLHNRESGCNFHCHLHNGDPLNRRTQNVPPGRPANGSPPFTWEESAIDAVLFDGLDKRELDSIEKIAYAAEGYNGWGYRHLRNAQGEPVSSPYLWGQTNQHDHGKFISDGVYSASADEPQFGVMPLLKELLAVDNSVKLALGQRVATSTPTQTAPTPTKPASDLPTKPTAPSTQPEAALIWRFLLWLLAKLWEFLQALVTK